MQLLSCKSDARCCLRPRSTAVKSAGKAVGNLHPQYIPLLNLGCIADSGQGVKSGTCPLPHDAAIAGSKRENHRKHTHVLFLEFPLKLKVRIITAETAVDFDRWTHSAIRSPASETRNIAEFQDERIQAIEAEMMEWMTPRRASGKLTAT